MKSRKTGGYPRSADWPLGRDGNKGNSASHHFYRGILAVVRVHAVTATTSRSNDDDLGSRSATVISDSTVPVNSPFSAPGSPKALSVKNGLPSRRF
jgi:hypothetical protein